MGDSSVMGRWLALATSMIVGACGSKAPTIAFSDFRVEEISARCDYLVRCGLFADHDVCTNHFRLPDDRSLAAAIADGNIRYDGAAALECENAISEQACDRTLREGRTPIVCDRIFVGLVAADDTCGFDLECSSGSCLLPGCPPGECCPGTCNPGSRGAIGAACQSDLQCVAESFCGVDRVCVPLVELGGSCRSDGQCAYGLGCVGKTDLQDGTCQPLPAIGQPCVDGHCAEINAACGASGTCVALGLAGATCTIAEDCSPFLECGASGTCADLPQLGMPCTELCAGEAWCDTGICSPPQADAAACTIPGSNSAECASQFCLEGPVFSQCATPPVCD